MLGKNRARERVDEQLSAYIDGALSAQERAQLEARLAQDADLRARLESLQRTVTLIRALPPVPAPRNFLLTPEMVRPPAPAIRPPAPAARRLAPALTFATAVSGLLCVILLVGNLIASGLIGPGAAAPAPMGAYRTGISPQAQQTQEVLAEIPPPPSETIPAEMASLTSAATISATAVPEMDARSEEAPSPLEESPSPAMGGIGGGAGPGPSLWEPDEPEEMEAEALLTPTPEPMLPAQAVAPGTEVATPAAETPTPTPAPVETPEAGPLSSPVSWLPVGGLALLTMMLAVLSIRAWRAR